MMRALGLWGVVATGLWLVGCAHVEAPPGGPVDKIPPYVSGVYPAPQQTGVARDASIQLQFSEWVKAEGLASQVVLSPTLPGRVRIRTDGDRIAIGHDSLLRENTTYRLVLPAQIKDMNGVALDSSFELVFSTGPAIDSGTVSGHVFREPHAWIRQARVALYAESREWALPRKGEKRKPHWPDSTVNAWREKPTYVAPVDSLGAFRFGGLPPGRYAVLAFVDANQNQLPDAGESMGVGPAALRLSDVTLPALSLRLGQIDTQALRLTQVVWLPAAGQADKNAGDKLAGALRVRFNRNLSLPKSRSLEAFSVLAAEAKGEKATLRLQPSAAALSPEGDVELWFNGVPARERLTLRVLSLQDDEARPLDTARASLSFEAMPSADSVAATYTFWRQEPVSGKPMPVAGEALAPPSQALLRASSPLTDSAMNALAAKIRVRADSLPLAITVRREGPMGLILSWSAPRLPYKTLYFGMQNPAPTAAAPGQADSAAKPASETPLAKWNLLTQEGWSSLRLTTDAHWLGWTGMLRRQNGVETRVFRFDSNRELKIDSLMPGTWRLSVFADQNGDGLWNVGSVKPWRSQEPAAAWPDTLVLTPGAETGPVSVGGSRLR